MSPEVAEPTFKINVKPESDFLYLFVRMKCSSLVKGSF